MSDMFAELKKKSGSGIQDLTKKVEGMSKSDYKDDTYWVPEKDKAGNYAGVIRFLPAPEGEDDPFVRLYRHAFKNRQGKWLIENCRTSIGESCPICDRNSELWNADGNKEANQAIVRNRKRKVEYHANILIVNDPKNPDNNGKVYRFKFGAQIFSILETAIAGNPDIGREGINPFDFWAGADFELVITKNAMGLANYETSKFKSPSAAADKSGNEYSDKDLKRIWGECHPLAEIVAEDKFLSYADLEAKLNKFLGVEEGSRGDLNAAQTLKDQEDAGAARRRRLAELESKEEEEAPFESGDSESSGDSDGEIVDEDDMKELESMFND